jgi:oligopeptide/dipeptide ABC transporter ATP-binding protein
MSSMLAVEGLVTEFSGPSRTVRAVDDVTFSIGRREIVGLVGSSGSGKSVTAMSIIGLVKAPGRVTQGRIVFDGEDLLALSSTAMKEIRGSRIAMVFQDPLVHLDPVRRIGASIVETLLRHGASSRTAAVAQAEGLLVQLHIPDPSRVMKAYPFQLSGGMCQRAMIAMALASDPDLLIADEATSALDATVQAAILALLAELARKRGTSLLVTTHNMRVVRRLCDRVIVMYAGRIVESGPVSSVLNEPSHPYTRALLDCVPSFERAGQPLAAIPGEPPAPDALLPGCAFAPRCRHVEAVCTSATPVLRPVSAGQESACVRAEEIR